MVVKRCATVWEGLQQIFGPSFVTLYGETPSTLWVNAIAELTDGEVEAGLVAVAKDCREYPPNLTEWLEYCRPKKPVRYLGRPMTRADMRKLLDGPVAKPEHRDAMLAKMRATVANAEVPKFKRYHEPPPLPVAGCTCKSEGTCDVCEAYRMLIAGDLSKPLPREEPREPGCDDDWGEPCTDATTADERDEQEQMFVPTTSMTG